MRWIVRQANRRRNMADWGRAAELYRLALSLMPDRHDLAVQAGNCFKEAGCYDLALKHYDKATAHAQRAEVQLQKGDALARGGAAAEAIEALEAAVALGHPRAEARLFEISQLGLVGVVDMASGEPRLNQPLAERFLLNRLTRGGFRDRRWLGSLDRTTHEKVSGPGVFWRDHLAFLQVGWIRLRHQERNEPLLVGVVAVRARIVSSVAVKAVHLIMGGRQIAEGQAVEVSTHASGRRLYAVNIWLDSAALPVGRRALTLTATDVDGGKQVVKTIVNILRSTQGFDPSESDAFVPSSSRPKLGDARTEVASRPARVRSAARRLIETPVREILVMRVDQLGDLSASFPSLRRLREIFPEARVTALVAPVFVEAVQSTGFCDEVLGLRLDYDHSTERRYFDAKEQRRVSQMFAGLRFDLAIDLCPGDETRALLKMVDAQLLVGFNPREFDYLDFGIDVISRDKVNRIAKISHAASVRMLIDALAEAQSVERPASPRLQDDREVLAEFSLNSGSYLVVHTGARHELNQWPVENYITLINKFSEVTGVDVVFFSDKPLKDEHVSAFHHPNRVRFLQKTSTNLFDALISNAAVMIGNDSGPKHLAAARGVEVVSLHVNRLNWNEWGQDSRGVVITKAVPCAGCGLNDTKMCAKEVLCLTSISVEDAFVAVMGRWEYVMSLHQERSTSSGKQ